MVCRPVFRNLKLLQIKKELPTGDSKELPAEDSKTLETSDDKTINVEEKKRGRPATRKTE